MNIVYLIGNGFDINLGLKTRYIDFYNYYKSIDSKNETLKFLKDSISNKDQNWSDLEIALGEYTVNIKTIEEFDEIFEDIGEQLAFYLESQESIFDYSQIDSNRFKGDLCFPEMYLPTSDSIALNAYKNKWASVHWDIQIITLNYTRSIEKLIQDNIPLIGTHHNSYQVNLKGIEHLHGFVDDRMILGVNDLTQIKNEDFHTLQEIGEALVKPSCNSASKSTVDTKCRKQIKSADIIYVFGSSIGDTDKLWWELIGDKLLTGCRLVIFTRGNEISRRIPYKALRHERDIRKYFLDKTTLTDSEKEAVKGNIFIGRNTGLFSNMLSF